MGTAGIAEDNMGMTDQSSSCRAADPAVDADAAEVVDDRCLHQQR